MYADITEDVISVRDLSKMVGSLQTGAVVSFSGDVRDNDHGRKVVSLEYEVHPSAAAVLKQIVHEVSARYSVERLAVAHRYGPIPIGDSALVVCVSAVHRESAFEACRELVEQVKKHIPVWKHQVFEDGTDEWVNCA